MGKQYVFGVFCFLLLTSAYFGPHFVLRSVAKKTDIEKMVDRKIYEYSCMSSFGQKEDIQIDGIWGFSLLHIYRLGSEMVISLLLLCLLLRMKQTHRSPKSRHPKKKKLKIFQNRKDIKITIESNTCTEQNWTKKSFNNKTRDTLYLFYCCKNQFKIPFKPIRNPFQNTNHRVSYTKTTRD